MTIPYSGFSIENLTLPHEDAAGHRRLYDEWMAAYPSRGPIDRGYAQHAVVALLEKNRIERIRTTVRTERVRTAVLDFERGQEDEVARCVALFNENCEYGLRHLLRSAAGCRWAIGMWEDLETKLNADGTWYGFDRLSAIQLQGLSACLDQLYHSEKSFRTWLDCLVAQPNPKQKDINRILDPHNVPKAIQDRDLKLWPGNPAESRARLHEIVNRELPRLRALEKTLRVQYEDPARAEAEDQALADVAKEEMALLRAEKMHEQSYDRAVKSFIKVRKQSAAEPVSAAVPVALARREIDESVPIVGIVDRGARFVNRGALREIERPGPSG
jgi:hypothetical protein